MLVDRPRLNGTRNHAPARERQQPGNPSPSASAPAAALLLTYAQAGELLQLSERTVRRLVARGDLPSVRTGASVRIPRAELVRWIEAQTRRGPRDAAAGGGA